MAACMAAKGVRVVGVDANPATVAAINRGEAPNCEPGLGELLQLTHGKVLTATGDIDAITDTDVTFVVVQTPSGESGLFSLRYVKEVAVAIGRVLRDKSGYHVVAITSTVLPGSL